MRITSQFKLSYNPFQFILVFLYLFSRSGLLSLSLDCCPWIWIWGVCFFYNASLGPRFYVNCSICAPCSFILDVNWTYYLTNIRLAIWAWNFRLISMYGIHLILHYFKEFVNCVWGRKHSLDVFSLYNPSNIVHYSL